MNLPARLGKYELLEFLGGGMSHVYRARDTVIGRTVAVKVLTQAGAEDAEAKARFLTEARVAGNLSHENIVSIHDFGEDPQLGPYLVMEFLTGESLKHAIRNGHAGDLGSRLKIALQVARALGYLHSQKIIHRDIKPENVHISKAGVAKIMDFGIAKTDGLEMTRAGYVMGSPYYMAPEQVTGQPVTPQVDVYAFGVLLFELLSGERPILGDTVERIFYSILNEPIKLDRLRDAGVPAAICDLVAKCTAKNPDERPKGFAPVLRVLEETLRDAESPTRTQMVASPAAMPHSPPLWVRFGAPVVVFAALLVFLLKRPGAPAGGYPPLESILWSLAAGLAVFAAPYGFRYLVDFEWSGGASANEGPAVRSSSPAPPVQAPAPPLAAPQPAAPVATPPAKPPAAAGPGEFTQIFPTGAPSAPAPSPLSEFTRLFSAPSPAGYAPPSPPPPPPAKPPADSEPGEFTRLLQASGAAPAPMAPPPAAPPPPLPANFNVEYTQMVRVPGPSGSPAAPAAAVPDVALSITACADSTCIGKTLRVPAFPFSLGRSGALAFDSAISREHAEIRFSAGGFFVVDLGSANGTFVNGKPLPPREPEPLLFGARILLGTNTQLTFVSNDLEELPDLTGTLIGGRYLLSSKIFGSAKSAVYVADHQDLHDRVAVKILSPKLVRHPGYREQFEHEARMASRLRHDGIARVFDYGETELGAGFPPSLYLTMEYFAGGNLANRLAKDERFDPERVAGWLQRLARGLDYIHGENVIHGGIKPTSIVFDSADQPHLSDFAIAVTTSDRGHRTVIGAPPFLAPEQWEGGALVPATDQYSLAALVYLVLTGVHPYEGQEHPEVRKRNYLRPPAPAHELAEQNLRPALPSAVSAVLRRAMAPKPEERYPSAQEFASAFRAAIADKGVPAPKKPNVFLSYRRGNSLPLALLIETRLERDHGCEVFVDVTEAERAGELPEYLSRSIARSDVFVCLLGKTTLNSPWVKREMEMAYQAGKPMVPVFQESFREPRNLDQEPDYLRKLLRCKGAKLYDRQGDYIPAAIEKLSELIRQSIDEP